MEVLVLDVKLEPETLRTLICCSTNESGSERPKARKAHNRKAQYQKGPYQKGLYQKGPI